MPYILNVVYGDTDLLDYEYWPTEIKLAYKWIDFFSEKLQNQSKSLKPNSPWIHIRGYLPKSEKIDILMTFPKIAYKIPQYNMWSVTSYTRLTVTYTVDIPFDESYAFLLLNMIDLIPYHRELYDIFSSTLSLKHLIESLETVSSLIV